MKKEIHRYTVAERSNHWMVAILFGMAGFSGLSLYHPAMFGLTDLFGGGPWTRILHPFLGVAMFLCFAYLVIRFFHHNLIQRNDIEWFKHINDVLHDHEERLPPVGRYNGGQKLLFWILIFLMITLLLSGIVLWRQYFGDVFSIPAKRVAAVVHASAAFALSVAIVVHVYAGIWIRGSVRAMLSGWVSKAWARKHHGEWAKEIEKTGGEEIH